VVSVSNLASVIDDRAAVAARSLTDEELDAEIAELHRAEQRLASLKVDRIAEADARRFFEALGFGSAAAWLRSRLGVRHGVARSWVGLGRALRHMLRTRDAFAAGDIGQARVRVLCEARSVDPEAFTEAEEILVDAAVSLPPKDFRIAIDYWRDAADAERFADDHRAMHDRRGVTLSQTWQGRGRLDGWLDPEGTAVVTTALRTHGDRAARDPGDLRSPPQVRADALVDICRFFLDHADVPMSGGRRPHLSVTVDLETIEGRAGHRAELDGAGRITSEAARRLACDASVSRVITRGRSEPLDVGRATRTVTAAQRTALAIRDGGCVVDGCGMPPAWCDAHHLEHWIDGGGTDLANLALVCRRHHGGIHHGGIELPERFRGPGP
jgi:hypothetical protein